MNSRKRLLMAFLLLFIAMILVSLFVLLNTYINLQKEQRSFEELAKPQEQITNQQTKTEYYTELEKTNPDFWCWLNIKDTKINYPVMHTPQNPEYYLHRDYEGNSSKSGVPFLDANCSNNCGNYLIYGHNMKNGTMFAELLKFEDIEYWQQHQTILLENSAGSQKFIILAAFYTEVFGADQPDAFRYYQYTDLTNPDDFNEYIQNIKVGALYDTGIEAEYGEQLLTLSTCSYHTENGRFVVVAKEYSKTP